VTRIDFDASNGALRTIDELPLRHAAGVIECRRCDRARRLREAWLGQRRVLVPIVGRAVTIGVVLLLYQHVVVVELRPVESSIPPGWNLCPLKARSRPIGMPAESMRPSSRLAELTRVVRADRISQSLPVDLS